MTDLHALVREKGKLFSEELGIPGYGLRHLEAVLVRTGMEMRRREGARSRRPSAHGWT